MFIDTILLTVFCEVHNKSCDVSNYLSVNHMPVVWQWHLNKRPLGIILDLVVWFASSMLQSNQYETGHLTNRLCLEFDLAIGPCYESHISSCRLIGHVHTLKVATRVAALMLEDVHLDLLPLLR